MDQIKQTSKLTSSNHSRCIKKAGKCHAVMQRAGFSMRGSKFIDYGFQIKYQKGTERGFFRIYINQHGVTLYDYSGVPYWGTIQQIKNLIRDHGIWEYSDKESLPAIRSRKIINRRHRGYGWGSKDKNKANATPVDREQGSGRSSGRISKDHTTLPF